MRWIPLLIIFIITYIEISLFIQVAHVLGVLATLLLVIATSFIGVLLVRAQGLRILGQMQIKLARGETFEGEYRRHDLPHDRLNDRRDDEK